MPAKPSTSTIRTLIAVALACVLVACQTGRPPEFGMVDWYVANGTGTDMTLKVFDKVCGRHYYRVRVPRGSETLMSTCANEAGRAEIRYSRDSGYSVSANPVRHDVVSRNQSLHVE